MRQTVSSEGWDLVLKPWLESKINNSWLDPKGSKSEEEFFFQYTVAYGFAQAAQQILEFVEQHKLTAESLVKKKEGKTVDKNFRVGGDQ